VQSSLQTLRKLINSKSSDWARTIPAVQFALNTKVAALHRSTPYALFFGRRLNTADSPAVSDEPVSELELVKRIEYMHNVVFPAISEGSQKQQSRMISSFQSKISDNLFPDGSYVMAIDPKSGDKLQPAYEGPFMVVRRTKGGSYVLRDSTGALTPRNYAPSQLKKVDRDEVGDVSYEIEAVLNHRKGENGNDEYLVRWKNYGEDADLWVPYKDFDDVACIDEYYHRSNIIPPKRKGLASQPTMKSVENPKTGKTSKKQPSNQTTSSRHSARLQKRAKINP
jgi:hypothetical protein